MALVIAFQTPDQLVSLLYPASGVSLGQAAVDIPADATLTWTGDDTSLPAGFRKFQQALVLNTKDAPSISMDKAREIFRDKIREARAPLFQKHDLEFMLALEKGEPTDAIVAAKQELRDLTISANIAAAKNLAELAAAWPAQLLDDTYSLA
jgi:hypothetical protein